MPRKADPGSGDDSGDGDAGFDFVRDVFGSDDEGGGTPVKEAANGSVGGDSDDDDLNSPSPDKERTPRSNGVLDELDDDDDDDEIVIPRRRDAKAEPVPRASAVLDALDDEDLEDEEDDEVPRRKARRKSGSSSKKRSSRSRDGSEELESRPKSRKLSEKKRRRLHGNDDEDDDNAQRPEDDGFIDDSGVKKPESDEEDVIRTEGGLGIGADIEDQSDQEEQAPKKPKNAFEEALEAGKAMRRPRKKDMDPAKVEQECIAFLERMMRARDEDVRCYKKGQPALSKLKMLREVELMTTKVAYRDALIDNMLLPIIKAWLDPMPDGALPNVQIRTSLLTILSNIRVDSDWVEKLKNSQGLGRVVHFLSRNDDDMQNRRMAEKLMMKWARPVYQSNADFHDILEEFDRPDEGHRAPKEGIVSTRRAARETVKHFRTTREKIDEFRSRGEEKDQIIAQIPRPTPFLYTALAEGSANVDEKIVKENRAARATNRKVHRTLSTMRRLNKNRTARAAKPSVNGR